MILRYINKLKNNKSAGVDDLPTNFIKRIATCITLLLYVIFNESLNEGVLSEVWKKAKRNSGF